jgi:predicted transglutaminase-like cysteine proteinase
MPKLRHTKVVFAAVLSGVMAALLVCLLCWNQGWSPAWAATLKPQAGAPIGEASVSEPPIISTNAAKNSVTANSATGQSAGQTGITGENAAVSVLPADAAGLAPDLAPDLAADQELADHAADHAADHSADHSADQAAPKTAADAQQSGSKVAPPATPSVPATQAAGASDSKVQLFGTVEFKRPLSTLPGWLDLLKRNSMDPVFIPTRAFKKGVTWDNFKSKAPQGNKMELLRYVNSFWNTWPYVEDIVNWKQEDYWEIPAEFLKKSGDCEDYSIIKYFTLKELGVAPESMRIVVVRDTIRNFAHAVLVVYLNGDAFILDNLSNSVLSHTKLRQYSPQYSVNEFGRWAHMKGRKIN